MALWVWEPVTLERLSLDDYEKWSIALGACRYPFGRVLDASGLGKRRLQNGLFAYPSAGIVL